MIVQSESSTIHDRYSQLLNKLIDLIIIITSNQLFLYSFDHNIIVAAYYNTFLSHELLEVTFVFVAVFANH